MKFGTVCKKAAVELVNAVIENSVPFASKGSLGYGQHWNPASTEHTSMASRLEPSGSISPNV
jgi:hypothetical protein